MRHADTVESFDRLNIVILQNKLHKARKPHILNRLEHHGRSSLIFITKDLLMKNFIFHFFMARQTWSNICGYQSFSSENKKHVTYLYTVLVDEFVGYIGGSHILVVIEDKLLHIQYIYEQNSKGKWEVRLNLWIKNHQI